MSDWTQDAAIFQFLPAGMEARFDTAGRLTFFGDDSDNQTSEFVEIDWASRTARYTKRTVVECDDGNIDDFIDRFAREIRRNGQLRESGGIECSFCQKSQKEVARIIAGPRVYICDECIRLCAEILDEDAG